MDIWALLFFNGVWQSPDPWPSLGKGPPLVAGHGGACLGADLRAWASLPWHIGSGRGSPFWTGSPLGSSGQANLGTIGEPRLDRPC